MGSSVSVKQLTGMFNTYLGNKPGEGLIVFDGEVPAEGSGRHVEQVGKFFQ